MFVGLLFTPMGMVFGSNRSPAEQGIVSKAQALITTFLIVLYTLNGGEPPDYDIMSLMALLANPPPSTVFVQAVPSTLNHGVLDEEG